MTDEIQRVSASVSIPATIIPPTNTENPAPTDETIRENKKKWPSHPWYYKFINQRYKLALLPLVGFFLPDADPAQIPPPDEKPFVRVVTDTVKERVREKPLRSSMDIFALLVFIDVLRRKRKKVAEHELGHFFANRLTQTPYKPLQIFTRLFSGGMKRDLDSTDDDKLFDSKVLCGEMIEFRAGGAILRALHGVSDIGDIQDEFVINAATLILMVKTLYLKPSQLHNLILFRFKLEKYTQELLKQLDPKVVEDLANELAACSLWEEAKLKEIIDKYKLNDFPKFEDQIPELKPLLEALDEKKK